MAFRESPYQRTKRNTAIQRCSWQQVSAMIDIAEGYSGEDSYSQQAIIRKALWNKGWVYKHRFKLTKEGEVVLPSLVYILNRRRPAWFSPRKEQRSAVSNKAASLT